MPPKCNWCENYYCAIRSQGLKRNRYHALCYVCTKLHLSGKYGYLHNLRPLPTRWHQLIDFKLAPLTEHKMRGNFVDTPTAITRVKNLTYHSEKPGILQLLANTRFLLQVTPAQLWAMLTELEIYLTAEEAGKCLKFLQNRPNLWRFQHALGCRVADWWNLTANQHGVASCYYNPDSVRYPQQLSDINLPEGQPYQHSDLG